MKISEIYQLAIRLGKEADPRGPKAVEKRLAKLQEEYAELKADKQGEFDQDRLTNPYSDTRILYGDGDKEIKRILTGIDIEVGEVLLADRLGEKGKPIDLILAHHPEGKAYAALHQVMDIQEDVMHGFGVPINVAEGIMGPRISEVKRGISPMNHNRTVDAARVLDIPLMCCHTPADNMVNTFLQKLFDEKQPETLGDVLKLLKEIPEYKEAIKINAGPTLFVGHEENRAGKIMVDMTGGTGGSEEMFSKVVQAGVGTIVGMHIGEKHRKEAEKNHVNVVIAGHIASDSLGMNLLLDKLAVQGVEIIPCSGLTRVER